MRGPEALPPPSPWLLSPAQEASMVRCFHGRAMYLIAAILVTAAFSAHSHYLSIRPITRCATTLDLQRMQPISASTSMHASIFNTLNFRGRHLDHLCSTLCAFQASCSHDDVATVLCQSPGAVPSHSTAAACHQEYLQATTTIISAAASIVHAFHMLLHG